MHAYTTSRISLPPQSAQPTLAAAFDAAPLQPICFFPAGSEIYAQGEKAGTFYQIEFGAVRVYRLLADGRRQISAFHLAGEAFGFEADTRHIISSPKRSTLLPSAPSGSPPGWTCPVSCCLWRSRG